MVAMHIIQVFFLAVFFTGQGYADATLETWNWMGFISSLRCTGALVNSRWLLTTSQCFQNKSSIPSELFVEVQQFVSKDHTTRARKIFVIDYTRDKRLEAGYGLTMLYLARTLPSLTHETIPVEQRDRPIRRTTANAIVLGWGSGSSFDRKISVPNSGGVNIVAMSVNVSACDTNDNDDISYPSRELCAFLDEDLSSATGTALYCPRINLGSPLVFLNDDGKISLAGILRTKPDCQKHTKLLGRFTRVDIASKAIRQQFRVQDHPQCRPDVYHKLDNSMRDLRRVHSGPSVLCDASLPRAWYRFTLHGQPAELPTSCPEANHCGSSSTVWLPTGSALEIGKQVSIQACATWTVGNRQMCCFWKLSLFVRHCGDFKVYRLRSADACPTAYCANVTKGYCEAGKSGYKPNCRDSYPRLPRMLYLYPFFAYQGRPQRPYVYIRCRFRAVVASTNKNVKYSFTIFKIERTHDGRSVKNVVRTVKTSRSYCDTTFLPRRHNIALGDTVVCEVSSFFRATPEIQSPPLTSTVRHLGIEVHPSSTRTVTQSESLLISFVATMPVVCPVKNDNCSLTIPLTTSFTDAVTGQRVDSDSYLSLSKCSLVFPAKHCTTPNNVNCGRERVLVKTATNLGKSNLKLQINLGPVVSDDVVWKTVDFPVVDVILKPTPYSSCLVMSGSNIKPFSGSFFKHLGEDTFLLYRKVSPINTEVQMKKWSCNGMSTCACAVAIREGNDVIVADMCSGQYKQTSLRIIVRSKPPLDPRTRIVKSNDGKTFTIKLSSGSYLTLDEFDWGISIFFATTQQLGAGFDGLCHEASSHNKIPETESLFENVVSTPAPSSFEFSASQDAKFCICDHRNNANTTKQDCPSSIIRTLLDGHGYDVTNQIIHYQGVLQETMIHGVPPRHNPSKAVLQADSPSHMSFDQRQQLCQKILNDTVSFLVCMDALGKDVLENIYQTCLQDAQEGLDVVLLQSNRKVVTRLCEHLLDSDVVLGKWKDEYCGGRCAENGRCFNGECICDKGFGSNDCSVSLDSSPKIFPLQDSSCDHRHSKCEDVFISGTSFSNSDLLSCGFTPVQRAGTIWKEEPHQRFTGKALFYSSRGVICTMPKNRRHSFIKSYDAYHISVSNNGQIWSNSVLRVIYDSSCKVCSSKGICSTKPGTCDIDSRCFEGNAVHSKNHCLKCSPAINLREWSPNEENLPPTFVQPGEDTINVFVNNLVMFAVRATRRGSGNGRIRINHDLPQAQLSSAGEFRWRPKQEMKRTIRFVARDECGLSTMKYIHLHVRRCLCRNGGKCPKLFHPSYKCICPEAFRGELCQENVLPCSSSPCVHGACVDIGTNFSCHCKLGYGGKRCDVMSVPACASGPCERGKCVDMVGGFRCMCPKYYGGTLCQKNVGPCGGQPCIRGTCHVTEQESFMCTCPEGYHGKLCAEKRTPCSPSPCYLGRCKVLGTSFRCICPPKHHGKYCNLTYPVCAGKLCVNGICETTTLGQRCVCQRGFLGEQCDVTCDVRCVNGDCVVGTLGHKCACHKGYTGQDCASRRSACNVNPCFHGDCVDTDHFRCRCYAGYTGTLCNMTACFPSCVNGTCMVVNGNPTCRCYDGFLGNRCDKPIRHPCDVSPCVNGLCVEKGDSFNNLSFHCACNSGFQGKLCDKKEDPCLVKPCKNGVCVSKNDGFVCLCEKGHIGRFCEEPKEIDPCLSNPCVYGTCMLLTSRRRSTQFRCKCHSGYIGMFCEQRFNICSSNPCMNGGSCFSLYEGTFYCSCAPGYLGTLCQTDNRPCSRRPCFKGVACLNVATTYQCGACPVGLVGNGTHCQPANVKTTRSPLACPRQFCFPNVKCSIVESQIHCGDCPPGYYGNGFQCSALCNALCQNGGSCIETGVCRCPPGYAGDTCQRALCKRRCLNGGRCIPPDKCRCPNGFYGNRCQHANCQVKCLNGGQCVPPSRCQCPTGYTGTICEQAICPLPCLNGGQCLKPATCFCPPGYFGTRCQEGTCFPRCRNGGVCVRNNNCACPKGYRGSRCQIAICRRPCVNGGRCFKKDQCSCPYGYWGQVCEHVRCLRACSNGGVCIRPNVCLCSPKYAGVSCELFVGS